MSSLVFVCIVYKIIFIFLSFFRFFILLVLLDRRVVSNRVGEGLGLGLFFILGVVVFIFIFKGFCMSGFFLVCKNNILKKYLKNKIFFVLLFVVYYFIRCLYNIL